ncbi:MAG: sigma-70 family RNA polymerase sigma factor [Chryseolinea sp.]
MIVHSIESASHHVSSDETVWTAAFRDGSRDALATLYFRYFKFLKAYGQKILLDGDAVKDSIQDLFVEMWNNKERLSIPRSVKAYLIISLQRKLIRYKKKMQRAPLKVDSLPDTEMVESKEDQIIFEQNLLDKQRTLNRAIKCLTKRQQEAIHLKFYANLSYEEIVGVMNISADAIYNLISKAIDTLQKQVPNIGN